MKRKAKRIPRDGPWKYQEAALRNGVAKKEENQEKIRKYIQ
jgi:hypothetical protein